MNTGVEAREERTTVIHMLSASRVSFAQAIILHAIGFNVRRESWPERMAVVGLDCALRVPRGRLAILVPDWDPSLDDMEARDWETDGRWKEAERDDVIDAEEVAHG